MEYYAKNNDKITCLLCRHYCKLRESQIGFCGVNKNTNSSLQNLVYGYPSAINIDPIEKKPLFHFLPSSKTFSIGTVGCNFRCPFCQNHGISQSKNINTDKYYTPSEIVDMAKIRGCKSISFTYNEPTIFYPFAKDISILAKKENIKTVFVSNGYESTEVISDMPNYIDAINVDLKSFDEKYYKKELKGKIEFVKDSLQKMRLSNMWIEITTLVIDEYNDNPKMLQDMASFIYNKLGKNTPWHLSAFHPDYKMLNHSHTKITSLQKAYEIGKKTGLEYVYMGNVNVPAVTNCAKCNYELIKRIRYNTSHINLNKNQCPNCNNILDGVF